MSAAPQLAYPRALLKISGEAFAGERGAGGGLDFAFIDRLAGELKAVAALVPILGASLKVGDLLKRLRPELGSWAPEPLRSGKPARR